MPTLIERLLKAIRTRDLIKPGDRVAAAVSGGLDSVSLLLLLLEVRAELGIVLSVAHVNHKLRGQESDDDEQFVAAFARKCGLELHTQVASLDGTSKSGIESAARKLRYDFFRQLARDSRVSMIATAHTLDDQAETVLLRIFRGTGVRGLAGIHPRLVLEDRGRACGEVVRPLLGFRRAELESFLRERDQPWREDSSNRDLAFLRNRVRHRLLPLLSEDFGAATVENLADLAEIARAEEEHWLSGHPETHVGGDSEGDPALAITTLRTLPLAAQRRLVRGWLEAKAPGLSVSFRLIEQLLDLVQGPAGKRLELPGGRFVRRGRHELTFETEAHGEPDDYEYRLPVPGMIAVPEAGIRIEAVLADPRTVPEGDREQVLDCALVPSELTVRNWRPGDRFWPAHTREEKKVKELLSDRHLAGADKKRWTVAVAQGSGLVWMRGFASPVRVRPPAGASRALWIRVIES